MRIAAHSGSYIGHRPNNEDSMGRVAPRDPAVLEAKGRLFVVCDGMGGASGGEIASQIAVETILRAYYEAGGDPEADLEAAIREASSAISDRSANDPELASMGSTTIALVVHGDRCIVGHVGDSRAYLLRSGVLRRMTRDHLHILDDLGVSEAEAETHPGKNILSRALGYPHACQPDIGTTDCRPGDRVLLCSDGLSDALTQGDIQQGLEQSTPEAAVELLLHVARSNDARDNATALVIFISRDETIEEPTHRIAFPTADVLSSPERVAAGSVSGRDGAESTASTTRNGGTR
ncbi:MAG TPA: protein phosphatase 2C domain-containing protein [Chthonomonadaceae bacterium]|nr:protein phosphatase 2C domain-containing protein [Chthonomonadaceae bacterium]